MWSASQHVTQAPMQMLAGGPVKTAAVEALRLLREQDMGDAEDLADCIHSRIHLPVLATIPQARPGLAQSLSM